MSGVFDPGAGLAGTAPVVMVASGDVSVDVVNAEYKRLEEYFHRLFGQDTELVVAV